MGKIIFLDKYKEKCFNRKAVTDFYSSIEGCNIVNHSTEWRTQHFKEVIGHYFRIRRRERRVTTEALARVLNIEKSAILRFEEGLDPLQFHSVKKLFIGIGLSNYEINQFLMRLNEYFAGGRLSLRSLQILFDIKSV